MTTAPTFASAREAAEVVRAGLGFLAAADATAMAAETQAQCLQILEQATAMGTAARASILAAFTSGQGYSADADYSPKAWLIHKTGITKGAAVAYTAWVRRAAAHPQVAQALAGGEISESVARTICTWTDKLPGDCRPPRTRSCSPRPRRGWTCGTWPSWPGRSTPGRCPRTRARTGIRRSGTGPSSWRPPSTAPGC